MIKWFIILFGIVLSCMNAEILEPYAINALSGNSSSDVIGRSVVIDSESNVYYTGTYEGTVSFGDTDLTSAGSTDMFLVKTDSSGNFIWAVSAGGLLDVNSKKIIIDSDDNLYITGNFKGTVSFGDESIEANGAQDAFIAKYDKDGTCLWAVNAGGNNADYGQNIGLDDSGNILLIGNYQDDIEFGNSITLSANAFQESFIALYNSSGVCQWASQVSGESFDFSSGQAVAVSNDAIYASGTFVGEADFGNSILLNSTSNNDIFVAEYNFSGVCQWANQYSGSENSDFSFVYDLILDESSNIYISGFYSGSFVPHESVTYNSNGEEDIFILKLDSQGDYLWSRSYGSTAYDDAYSLALGDFLYVAGSFSNTLEFSSEVSVTSNGSRDIYTALFDTDGEFKGVYNTGSTGKDLLYEIVCDENNLGYITGSYEDDIDFSTDISLLNSGASDAFFVKFNFLPVIIETIEYNLSEGWNYISSNVIPDETDIISVFSEIENDIVVVRESSGDLYIPSFGINSIGDIAPDKVYEVYCSSDVQLSITGEQVVPEDYIFNLKEGWNYIPYLRSSTMSPATALNSIIDDVVILIDNEGKIFIPDLLDTIENLKIGKGYKIYLKNQAEFIFPEN